MATSRKDKSRKKNLTNFKNKAKKKTMSNLPEQKPFHQVPTWKSTESFEIQGSELEALYNYFNIVAPAFTAIQQVFARGIQNGKIQIGYQYADGTPVEDDEIKAYTSSLNAYFKDKMQKEGINPEDAGVEVASIDTDDVKEEAPAAKILNIHGAPVTQQG
jgi:hypothetical protein